MLEPVNLDEMVQFIEYKKKVDLECDAKKEEINLITENVIILGEFSYRYKIVLILLRSIFIITTVYRQT